MEGTKLFTRADIVRVARCWIGTPYHHQASERGVGADCLGLVRGVWRDIHGQDAETPPAYTRDWAEVAAEETLLLAASRHLEPIEILDCREGDVIVFRLRSGMVAKHVGIMTMPRTFLHAMEGGPACEVPLGPWWKRRIAAAFSFPGVID